MVLAGLRDTTLQVACTTQALLGNIKDISSLVEFCYHCGGKKYGNGSRAAREKDCKAYSSTCVK